MFLFINEEAGLKAIAYGVIPKADTVKYFVVLNGIPEDRVEVDYHEDGTGSFVAILNDDWEYMLVLTKDEVKIMEYTSYNKFKEVSIREVAERVTTEDMAHIIRVLDSAISKVEEGKLPYYI